MTVEKCSEIIIKTMRRPDHLIAKTQLVEVMASHIDKEQRAKWRQVFRDILDNLNYGLYADQYFCIKPYNDTYVQLVHYAGIY